MLRWKNIRIKVSFSLLRKKKRLFLLYSFIWIIRIVLLWTETCACFGIVVSLYVKHNLLRLRQQNYGGKSKPVDLLHRRPVLPIFPITFVFQSVSRLQPAEDIFFSPRLDLLLLTDKLKTRRKSGCRSLISYRRGRAPAPQFAPIIPRWDARGRGMVQVNWLEWIVLRCEPKTDTDGNMVEVVGDGWLERRKLSQRKP